VTSGPTAASTRTYAVTSGPTSGCAAPASPASVGARLVAVHASSDVEESAGGLHRRTEEWAELAEEGGALLADEVRAVTELHPELLVEEELVHDTSLRALLRKAREARVLVVGHRGVRPAHEMGLGSTSRGLVEFAPSPVIVIPPVVDPAVPEFDAMEVSR
jgi:nucleotide-binding universal stress UspA family protein